MFFLISLFISLLNKFLIIKIDSFLFCILFKSFSILLNQKFKAKIWLPSEYTLWYHPLGKNNNSYGYRVTLIYFLYNLCSLQVNTWLKSSD
jgi:hypothetical protein